MIEGAQEASWEFQKQKMENPAKSPDFHLEKKEDPVEKLIDQFGPDGAFDELIAKLDADPENAELRRQANLIVNRIEDLRRRVQH